MLIKNTIRNNNSHANNKPNNYDGTKQAQRKKTNTHAFCHSRFRNQSLIRNTQNFQMDKFHSIQLHSNSINSLNKFLSISTKNFTNQHITHQTVNFITLNRPLVETSTRPIVRRFRGPNKTKTPKTPTTEHQSTRPPLVTISTQTEKTTTMGKEETQFNKSYTPEYFPSATTPR